MSFTLNVAIYPQNHGITVINILFSSLLDDIIRNSTDFNINYGLEM